MTRMKPSQRYAELFILALIVYSIVAYLIELELDQTGAPFFVWSERIVTFLFTVEYLVRWWLSRNPLYPFKLMALIDLVAILPFYLSFLVDLRALRLVRVLRIFRLFKLYRYSDALQSIVNAFFRVRHEFAVIGFAVLTLGLLSSVAVYELERDAQPQAFARFSDAVWYTLTTLTTVGYGDKVPITPGGRTVAVFLMIAGLGLFGTFVSLIGGAFLEELRSSAARAGEPRAAGPAALSINAHRAFARRFDPAEVLRAIDQGAFATSQDDRQAETVRLLALACRHLMSSSSGKPFDTPPGD
jgi:voltage-gated potassium channel